MPAMAAFSKAALDGGIEHDPVQSLYQVALYFFGSVILITEYSMHFTYPRFYFTSSQACFLLSIHGGQTQPDVYMYSHLFTSGFIVYTVNRPQPTSSAPPFHRPSRSSQIRSLGMLS